jgi:hypothetical protein
MTGRILAGTAASPTTAAMTMQMTFGAAAGVAEAAEAMTAPNDRRARVDPDPVGAMTMRPNTPVARRLV